MSSSSFIEIMDPRSPTVDFVRTPLRIVKKIIDEENIPVDTRIINNSFTYASFDNLVESTPKSTVTNINDTDDSFHSAVGENDTEPLIANMKTPELKVTNKTYRKALGCIKNRLTETPKLDLRHKLWRNMDDERVKKSINAGIENTPPFKDTPASAPPKLYRRHKYT